MKRSIIYLRNGHLYVNACSQTTSGLWIDDGPCIVVDDPSMAEQVGGVVQAAMKRSVIGIPHPTSWAAVQEPLLRASGFKTWSAFGRKAKCVTVRMEGSYAFEPTRNEGSGGFVGLKDKATTLSLPATPSEIGEAVLAVLKIAE